jgi:hypothetical protein
MQAATEHNEGRQRHTKEEIPFIYNLLRVMGLCSAIILYYTSAIL